MNLHSPFSGQRFATVEVNTELNVSCPELDTFATITLGTGGATVHVYADVLQLAALADLLNAAAGNLKRRAARRIERDLEAV